ncbi:MAG: glycosyltransferase family A protein [Nanoarchaeota archaeon]|nr:glycosyltransferase family A protein [Nanoarchaeota archaeon]
MKICICLAVHNNEKHLENCLNSVNNSVKHLQLPVKTFLCLNGCKDNSRKRAIGCKNSYPSLNIEIIKSCKGKLNAQKKMISLIPKNARILFIDSDTIISENSIKILLDELNKHKELIAVGGFPVAKKYTGLNPWKIFLDNVLNIRSRHPMSEVSKLDVMDYHRLAITDPQNINTEKEHELRSKIFFHGRLFLLRSEEYWNMPKKNKNVVGDDSYLPDYIINKYGKNRIRIRYDAVVYFEPFVSIKKHYQTYKRIYFDLKNLKQNFPQFSEIRERSVLVLDKEYIKNQHVMERIKFFLFDFIRRVERISYNISLEKNSSKIWK